MDGNKGHTPADAREAELIRRGARGDGPAFEAFCARVEGPLYGYALGMTGSPQDAEDIVQESLLRLYRLLVRGGLHEPGAARALVFASAHNLAVDYLRRRGRVVPLDERRPAAAHESAARALLREQVERALEELPESHRGALMLREFGGLTYAEIACALDANVGEVKVWIHRARKRLAALLDRDGQYVGDNRRGV